MTDRPSHRSKMHDRLGFELRRVGREIRRLQRQAQLLDDTRSASAQAETRTMKARPDERDRRSD
jgi:hypothetical protein